MPAYDVRMTPGVQNIRNKLYTVISMPKDDEFIMDDGVADKNRNKPKDQPGDAPNKIDTGTVMDDEKPKVSSTLGDDHPVRDILIEKEDEAPIMENMGYSPAIGDISSVIRNEKEVQNPPPPPPPDPNDDPKSFIVDDERNNPEKNDKEFFTEAVSNYRHSVTYPLNSRDQVSFAVRTFNHVIDPADRQTLAESIVKRQGELGMNLKITCDNTLYRYVPDTMKVKIIAENVDVSVYGFEEKPGLRTKKEIVEDRLKLNSVIFNNLVYNPDYVDSIKKIKQFDYLDYFYPSVKTMNFQNRLSSALGGLGCDAEFFQNLMDTKAFERSEFNEDERIHISTEYDTDRNWYKESTEDLDHIMYCLKLYNVIDCITRGMAVDDSPVKSATMLDWQQQIYYYYDLLQDAKPKSDQYFKYCQYLHDLCWDPLDDPHNAEVVSTNVIAFVKAITPDVVGNMNEGAGVISKEDVTGFLAKELSDCDDGIFLCPDTLEYPVINQGSVRMGMDNILRVDPDKRETYVKNLNHKYFDFNCKFTIPNNHPYAKYAKPCMIAGFEVLVEDSDIQDDGAQTDLDHAQETKAYHRTIHWNYQKNALNDYTDTGTNPKRMSYPNSRYTDDSAEGVS